MPDRLMLQCRLKDSDGWRTVSRFDAANSPTAQRAAEMLTGIGVVWWRVLTDDRRRQVLAIHDGRRWQAVGESEPAAAAESGPMPWFQPAAGLVAQLQRLRGGQEFADTVPTNPNGRKG